MGDKLKMIRLTGKSLDLATEIVEYFKKKGYRASWTSVVDTAVPIFYAVTLGK